MISSLSMENPTYLSKFRVLIISKQKNAMCELMTKGTEQFFIRARKELNSLIFPCMIRNKFVFRELEDWSPSRLDGINADVERLYRWSYCEFLKETGMKIKV